MLKVLLTVLTIMLTLMPRAYAKDPLVLDWPDLVPKSERDAFYKLSTSNSKPIDHSGGRAQQMMVGHTRPELNNSYIKIPGFVIPLEGDQNTVTEFLLVPYFGACIHVPPPPPNQIIYVKFPKGAPVQELWDLIYVVGTLSTETQDHELAETGYTLKGMRIEPYEDD